MNSKEAERGRKISATMTGRVVNHQKHLTEPPPLDALPAWLDLSSPASIRRFMREVLLPSAITGRLGVRVVTACTTLCRTLLESEQSELLARIEQKLGGMEKQRKGEPPEPLPPNLPATDEEAQQP